MSAIPPSDETRMLPDQTGGAEILREPAESFIPSRQLSEVPRDELSHLAEEFGLDPTKFKTRQALIVAIHDRRQLIASLDRDAMLDVVRWGRRPVTSSASKEQIAQEIARIRSMRFAGLSQPGLVVLARLRGIEARDDDPVPVLVRRLRKKEGLFSRLNRKRRAFLGGVVARMIGEEGPSDYQFLPGDGHVPPGVGTSGPAPIPTLREDIEESGLFGGISNRIKKTADQYLNQKLDEIEARIDRKLDEIDRRLAEWRDKEIANRIRILKITLWASVIVAIVSLIYSYITEVVRARHQ
ncbi:MAG TPA: hypothetical protein VK797_03445 [Tepidisphaeraceae bacterium]|nr:hypothetical protein [Tepidisphaeraceae bacterium]